MHIHVLLPGAFWPGKDSGVATRGLALEALETLIARGRREAGPPIEPEHWLLGQFGVGRQRDWPSAPYCLLGDGGAPGEDVWMRADPVHLRAGRDHIVLADTSRFDITREESDAFAASINTHFAGRFTLLAQHPQRWYLRLPASPDIETEATARACGDSIDAHLPRGTQAVHWHALANELQMLLHQHPANDAREARGEIPVNGIWAWGAGRMAPIERKPFRLVVADDTLALGLARACGAASASPPATGEAWLASASTGTEGSVLLVLGALRMPHSYADAPAWREGLAALEREWFRPLRQALSRGVAGMLTLHLLGAERSLRVEITRTDLRRFWRRVKPLAAWRG
jgi:hypothetical protein